MMLAPSLGLVVVVVENDIDINLSIHTQYPFVSTVYSSVFGDFWIFLKLPNTPQPELSGLNLNQLNNLT
jgi:hypothetical protein